SVTAIKDTLGNTVYHHHPYLILIKSDVMGLVVWAKRYVTQDEYYPSVYIDNYHGGFLLIGRLYYAYDSYNVGLVKVSLDGNIVWIKKYKSLSNGNLSGIYSNTDGTYTAC